WKMPLPAISPLFSSSSQSKAEWFRKEYLTKRAPVKNGVETSVHKALAGTGISASDLRYVDVFSKGGSRKGKQAAYINYIDSKNGVLLTSEMFKRFDENPADKQLWAPEIIWQSWVQLAVMESRVSCHLRTVGQLFVENEETMQIFWDANQYSLNTRTGSVRGQVDTPFDEGFFALLGSPNGKTVMRMFLDYMRHIGFKTVERIILVGDEEKDLNRPNTKRTFLLVLSNKRRVPTEARNMAK
ncbi:MAG: hypothetical protein Q9214_005195, partial [Letrouitia sp. 1 TL-2023]